MDCFQMFAIKIQQKKKNAVTLWSHEAISVRKFLEVKLLGRCA